MARLRSRPFVPYAEALEEFTSLRQEFNDYAEKDGELFLEKFEELKVAAANENTVAMDVLAYYYKSGVEGILSENYMRYVYWELVSAARGNQLAIEKLQFLIGHACDAIIECEDYQTIAYKNDIEDDNLLYILGKALAKIIVREQKIFPVDLYDLEDEYAPYKKEYYVNLRHTIDEAIPKTIAYLKS